MTLKKAVGIGLGLLGVVVVVGWSTFPITTALILSVGASLAAAASYGIASVYIKVYLGKVNSLATSTSSQFFAAIFLIPLAFAAPPTRIPTLTVLLAVAALAVFCTAATLLLFVWLIAHAGPTKALTVTFLAPVFGVFWGVLFLKEPLTISPFIGLIIILFGAGLVTELLWPAKRKRVAAVSAALDEHSLVAQTSESEFAS